MLLLVGLILVSSFSIIISVQISIIILVVPYQSQGRLRELGGKFWLFLSF